MILDNDEIYMIMTELDYAELYKFMQFLFQSLLSPLGLKAP